MLHNILQSIAAAFRPGSFDCGCDRWIELEDDSAADKHAILVAQARIRANGGTVRTIGAAEHAAKLKARRTPQ
jgi:hypothetical protein